MKKRIVLIWTILFIVSGLGSVSTAATTDDVLDALDRAKVPEAYILQTKAYLDENPISAASADAVVLHIDKSAILAGGELSFDQLSDAQKAGILREIAEAAVDLDLRASYDDGHLVIRDHTGQIVFLIGQEAVIKQTGHDYSIVLIGLGFLLLAAVLGFILASKGMLQR